MSTFVETNSRTVRVSSENQSIWASGPRSAIEWSEYFPIIGGDRDEVIVRSAVLTDGLGKVTIDGERINYDPEGNYDGLANGATELVVIAVTLEHEDGSTEVREFEIEARGTHSGTGYVMPETGKTSTDEMNFAAVDAADILNEAHVFSTFKPIDIDWDAMDAIQPAIDAVLGGLKTAKDAATSAYNSASASATAAANKWNDAKSDAALVNKTYGDLVDYNAKKLASDAATFAYNTAKGLADIVESARLDMHAKNAARAVAETAFNVARTAVSTAEDALNWAQNALVSAARFVNDVIGDILDAVPSWMSGAIEWLAGVVGLDDELRAARDAVDRARDAVNDRLDDLAEARVDFSGAQRALDRAEDAATAATDKWIDAAADLTEELAGKTLNGLKWLADKADDAERDAWNDFVASRQDMWDAGLERWTNPDLGDVAKYNAKVAAAWTEKVAKEGLKGAAWIAKEAAEGAYDLAYAAVDSTDISVKAEVSVDVEAQAGLQVDMVLDAGSVDTDIDYKVDTTTVLDTAADTVKLSAHATNETTGDSVAFETVSPNLQFYAGIAYEVAAEFNLLLDLYAKVAGLEVIDVPGGDGPLTLTETLHMDGWIDIIDFDSTELGSIDVPIPGWVGDILQVKVGFPTVETEGKAAEVSADVYSDPTGFSMDELTDAILNLAEAKLDFSPEFRALLIEQGIKDDITSSDLGQAFVDALGAILKTIVGEGDTDGDGVVPIFMLDNTDKGVDGLFHLNTIEDVISEVNIDEVGEFGFFYAEGKSDNAFQVTVDVDQLVATAVNVAVGNTPETTINPLDLSFGLSDIFKKASIPAETQKKIEKFVKVEFGFEAADFDVRAGANFSQKFALSVDDMQWKVQFEDGTTQDFKASEGGEIVIENASELVDTNGNGEIDYTLALTPDATFFNDTQVGLNLGYTLDFIKAKAELLATLPLDEVFKGFDWSALGFDEAPSLPSVGFDLGLGPILRMEGDLDVLSADIFEDIFAFNAGSAVIEGSFTPVEGTESATILLGNAANNTLIGTKNADEIRGFKGNDLIIAKNGDDMVRGDQGKDKIRAGGGDDEVNGGRGRDILVGNKGDDELTGGKQKDTFVFKKGDGSDVITDFEVGLDMIKITKGAASMAALSFTQMGDDVEVSFKNVDILVEDVTVAQMNNVDNFAF